MPEQMNYRSFKNCG